MARVAPSLALLLVALAPAGVAAAGSGYEGLGSLEREAVDAALAATRLELEPAPRGQRLGEIRVVNLAVFSPREGFLQWFNVLHLTSRPGVVAREVLLRPGDRWDEALVDESRRNLVDPFLSNVVVLVPVRSARPGVVDLLVVTRDVWSLRLNTDFEIQDGIITFLTFSISENNLFGRRKKLAVVFAMDQGAFEVGPTYIDNRLGGSHLVLRSSFRTLFSREEQAPEGTRSSTIFGYPLWSLRTRWSALAEVDHFDSTVRFFQGAGPLPYDNPDTAEVEAIPVVYDNQTVRARGELVRSFGYLRKQLVSVGHELDRVDASLPADFAGDEVAAAAFTRDVLPRSELASAPFLRYRLFEARFATARDLDTFDLREDLRLGPALDVKVAAATTALGSDQDFLRLTTTAQWAWDLGGGFQRLLGAWQGRLDGGELIDNVLSARLIAATPKLGRLLRVITALDLDLLVHETNNRFFALGGANGLRGYAIGEFIGRATDPDDTPARLVGHVEVRSMPVPILFTRLGVVTFWDVGHAADRVEELAPRNDVGLGLRWLIPQANPFVLRIDWAVALHGPTAGLPGRASLGFAQAF